MNPFIAKDDGKYVLFSITFAVVPYVGTWIEIAGPSAAASQRSGRSLRGNVDRNTLFLNVLQLYGCRSLRGNVDRNVWKAAMADVSRCRSLRGNVDRNCTTALQVHIESGRSLRGNVDRNTSGCVADGSAKQSFPTWERG